MGILVLHDKWTGILAPNNNGCHPVYSFSFFQLEYKKSTKSDVSLTL